MSHNQRLSGMQRSKKKKIHNEENQPIKSNPKLTEMIKLVDKDIRTIITIFHMFES